MTSRPRFWNIDYEEDYINQMIGLSIQEQSRIENAIKELPYYENPRDYGQTDDCGSDDEDCPFIVAIYPGLAYEFMFEMNPDTHTLIFIDCCPLDIFHPQEE